MQSCERALNPARFLFGYIDKAKKKALSLKQNTHITIGGLMQPTPKDVACFKKIYPAVYNKAHVCMGDAFPTNVVDTFMLFLLFCPLVDFEGEERGEPVISHEAEELSILCHENYAFVINNPPRAIFYFHTFLNVVRSIYGQFLKIQASEHEIGIVSWHIIRRGLLERAQQAGLLFARKDFVDKYLTLRQQHGAPFGDTDIILLCDTAEYTLQAHGGSEKW